MGRRGLGWSSSSHGSQRRKPGSHQYRAEDSECLMAPGEGCRSLQATTWQARDIIRKSRAKVNKNKNTYRPQKPVIWNSTILERKYCIYLFLPRNFVFLNQIQSCFINRLIIICVHTFNLPEDSKLWDKYWAWLTVSVRAKSTAQCFLNTCIYIITSCFPMRCENNVLHRV